MRQELSTYIAELLYGYDRLVVPGLGGFELSHAPALVDQVQGQVGAPAKQVRFNENLVLDDGLFVAHIQARRGESAAAASAWLDGELADIKAALDRRDIVELTGVGRFFRNYELQLQFVADQVNFNTDAYGLRPVALQPVHRTAAERTPPAPAATVTSAPTAAQPSLVTQLGAWGQRYLSWWIGLAVVLFALVIYVALFAPTADTPEPDTIDVPQERLNTSPSKDVVEDETPLQNTMPEAQVPSPPTRETTPATPVPTPERAPTPAVSEHTAVIAVGLFGQPENAARMVERIAKRGFAPVTHPEKNGTRVAIQVTYSTEKTLNAALAEAKKHFAPNAFIISIDGERVK